MTTTKEVITEEEILAIRIKEIIEERANDINRVDYANLGRIERHIYKVARENQLDYWDLLYATKTIEAKHKGLELEEVHQSQKVVNHSQKLWDIAYHTALYAKAAKHEFWKFY